MGPSMFTRDVHTRRRARQLGCSKLDSVRPDFNFHIQFHIQTRNSWISEEGPRCAEDSLRSLCCLAMGSVPMQTTFSTGVVVAFSSIYEALKKEWVYNKPFQGFDFI